MNTRFERWGRHPCAFTRESLEAATAAAAVPIGGTVVDPFVGSGTSATFVTGRGDRFFGIEAHPLFARLALVKLARPGPGAELRAVAQETIEAARRVSVDLTTEPELLHRVLTRQRLEEFVSLREAIDSAQLPWREHLRWALVGSLRDVVGSAWPYSSLNRQARRADRTSWQLVMDRVSAMADDLEAAPREPSGRVLTADARTESAWGPIPLASATASISSPPYLNQVSYAEATRLELLFLREIATWREMTEKVSRCLVASCTQQVSIRQAQRAVERLAACPGTATAVGSLALRLRRIRTQRTRGKAYDLLLPTYFADMGEVLLQLRRALAPGGRAAWVIGDSAPYGVYVDTPALIGLLAAELGFEILDDRHLRERGKKWRGISGRHSRPLSERLLIFQRPAWGEQQPLPGLEFA